MSFLDDAVLVGHNVRYDLSFLNAELRRAGLDPLENPRLDTLALARRLVRDEVPNCKLATLSQHLRLAHQPSHRALDDVLATADLLHLLVERAATFGIASLDELIALPRLTGHPQAGKLKLTEALPHAPGVYLFRDRRGNVLYVGKASDLKSRVRSYFSTDDRRKVGALLRDVHAIDHETCRHPLEAAVREVQLIHELVPRYNDHATRWRKMAYLRLTDEDFPRFSVVRDPPADAVVVLGPLTSSSAAHRAAEAIADVVPLRRCTRRVPKRRNSSGQLTLTMSGHDATGPTPCTPAQLGVACCPCSGETSSDRYAELVDQVRHGIELEPSSLLDPLATRLSGLAAQQRFEEAADVRDRAAALAEALRRRRRLDAWRRPARIVVERPDGAGAELRYGLLVRSWAAGERPTLEELTHRAPPTGPIPRDEYHHRSCLVTELERARSPWAVVHVEGTLASPIGSIRGFGTRERGVDHR